MFTNNIPYRGKIQEIVAAMLFVATATLIASLNASEKKFFSSSSVCCERLAHGVQPYDNIRHREPVKAIALSAMPMLTSTLKHSPKAYLELLKSEIIPVLDDERVIKKVYLHNGKVVGFITYSIYEPWHRVFTLGPNADIHHLAIDEAHRNNGYGKALLQKALSDCREQSVNKVSLWTTDGRLDKYYANFGFNMVHRSRLHAQLYKLPLKPHPVKVMARTALSWFKRR